MLVCKAGFHLRNGKGIHSNVHHNGGAYVNKCMDMHSTINTVQTIYWGELMSYATCGTCMRGQMSIPQFPPNHIQKYKKAAIPYIAGLYNTTLLVLDPIDMTMHACT